ncbi:hypothetical protein ACMFMG_006127 [Clarireedia jacksonii]
MLGDWDREEMPVDYGVGVEEVYERFARVLLGRNPALLVAVDHGAGEGLLERERRWREKGKGNWGKKTKEDEDAKFRLPSWVPDWRQEEDTVPIWPTPCAMVPETTLNFRAGGEFTPQSPRPEILPHIPFSQRTTPQNPLTLRLRGIIISRIAILDPDITRTSLKDLAVPGEYSSFPTCAACGWFADFSFGGNGYFESKG